MQRKKVFDTKIKDHEADEELLLWEKWIRIRQSETTRLGLAVHRPPIDLTMNACEKVREKNEWKTVLEHAQIKSKPTCRGHPWHQAARFKQACPCKPVYEARRTKAEMGKPRVIEQISVPNYIQVNEKGMVGESEKRTRYRDDYVGLQTDFLEYKRKREEQLKKKILKINPFKPDAAELMIKGNRPRTPSPKLPPLPTIIVKEPTGSIEDNLSSVYAIRINNTVICKLIPGQNLEYLLKMTNEPWHEKCTEWAYYFNTPVKRAGRAKMRIENLGTVALRYCWKKIKKSISFIPESLYDQVFFFNKNEDVLSPGQSKEICFTFLSDTPNIYSEYWEMSFANICFYDSMSTRLCAHLTGDSIENVDKITKKCNILKARIEKKAATNIASDILSDVIEKATTIRPEKYSYKSLFLENDMFLMKNPVCFYHQTEVAEMSRLYTEMRPNTTWDLSIASWREVMMNKDYDDRMRYFELLKKSHSELLKPWFEGESLLKQKYRAVNLILGQMADGFDKEYDRVVDIYNPERETEESDELYRLPMDELSPAIQQYIHNVFYIHVTDTVASAIELLAGVLSSLDLNRWIDFDFCRR